MIKTELKKHVVIAGKSSELLRQLAREIARCDSREWSGMFIG